MTIGLDVEHVLHRGHAGAERQDRLVHELDGQLVVALQRPRPDAARQPVAAALAHDVEQVGLVALLLAGAGADLHRAAARVGLHAAAPPAGAARAVALDDHVADLAGGAAADPRAAVEDDAAADAGAPEHAEQRAVRAPRAERASASVATWTSLPSATRVPSALDSSSASGKLPSQSGRLRALVTVPCSASTSPGEPTPMPSSSAVATPAASAASLQRADHRRRHVGRPAARRRGHARLAADLVVVVDDHRLDLRAAEVDATAHGASVPAPAGVRSAPARRPTIGA